MLVLIKIIRLIVFSVALHIKIILPLPLPTDLVKFS